MKYESYEEYDEVRFGTTGGSKELKRLQQHLRHQTTYSSIQPFGVVAFCDVVFKGCVKQI